MVDRINRLSLWVFLSLVAYMPFHVFLSIWLGSSLGILEITKAAKDVAILFSFILLLPALFTTGLYKSLAKPWLIKLILIFIFLNTTLFVFKRTDLDAATIGLTYNVRFFVMMLTGLILARIYPDKVTPVRLIKIILTSALFVVAFGILQYFVLPRDFLTHLGYSRTTGAFPLFFIDDKTNLPRIMSTLRDPNSLGSYLLIPMSLILAKQLNLKKPSKNALIFLGGIGLCLILSFSRSALVGAATATLALIIINKPKYLWRKRVGIAAISLVCMLVITGFFMRNTYIFKNLVFHADEQTEKETPEQIRQKIWLETLQRAKKNPLGEGPGTAGLASIKNEVTKPNLNENYYLQILTENGFLGAGLFITIIFLSLKNLTKKFNESWVPAALFAGLLALSITNFFLHIWANEAVAISWWSLFGVYMGRTKT